MTRRIRISIGLFLGVLSWDSTLGQSAPQLDPLAQFRGTRLGELKNRMFEGAVAAANAGAGYEAVRLLQGLAAEPDEVGKRATQLLANWQVAGASIEASRQAAINQAVRNALESEFQSQSDLKQAEVLLGFGDFAGAAKRVHQTLQRPLVGKARTSLVTFCRRQGIAEEAELPGLKNASESDLAEQLKQAAGLLSRVEVAGFLLQADPSAGRMYWELTQKVHPKAAAVRAARKESQEDESRNRFRFGGRTMPPNLRERFGNRFGFGGGREAERESAASPEPVELTVSAVVQSLDYLAKDDTAMAIDLLTMAIQVLGPETDVERLKTMLDQAELYQLANGAASASQGGALVTDRFSKKPKAGKAGPIFNGDEIPVYDLEISDDAMASLKADSKAYVSATFRSGDTVLENIGVRLKGGIGSYRPLGNGNKVGLTLKMNQFVKGQKYRGLRKIMLNNSVQDRSYLREGLGYALYREAGLPAPRVGHAQVRINGEPYGLYVQVEATTTDMLKRWFQEGKGDLYEGAYGTDITDWDRLEIDSDPDAVELEHLKNLAAAAEQALDQDSLDPLRAHLDVTAFSRYLALEVLMDHWDGYISSNNYRLYRDPVSKKFYFLPHGADQLFRNSGGDLVRDGRGVVAQAIFRTSEGRELYFRQVDNLMAGVLQSDVAKEWLRERYEEVRPRVTGDARSSYTVIDFDDQMIQTLAFFDRKQRMVRWQKIALDDPELSRRLEGLNNDPRRFFRGGRGRR